jgi:hypothetical protein
MAKKPPISALQWNAVAIMIVLVALPFATAVISNAGSSSDGDAKPSTTMDPFDVSSQPFYPGIWWDNGINLNAYYEAAYPMPSGWYNCGYIVDGECGDDYSYSNEDALPLSVSTIPKNIYGEIPSYTLNQNHKLILAPGEYYGSSGEGPFSFYFYGKTFDNIAQNDTLDKISYKFVDFMVSYDCEYNGFEDFIIKSDLTFIYQGQPKTFKDFEFKVDNSINSERWNSQNNEWVDDCIIGFELEYDFTGYESLSLTEFNGGDWANTDHLIELKSIKKASGQNMGNAHIPFAGDGIWSFSSTHQSVNTVQAGFVIKSATLFLSFGTFALAIASTPYWDPFKNFFKGAI